MKHFTNSFRRIAWCISVTLIWCSVTHSAVPPHIAPITSTQKQRLARINIAEMGQAEVHYLGFSAQDALIFAVAPKEGSATGEVRLVDFKTKQILHRLATDNSLAWNRMQVSADGSVLAAYEGDFENTSGFKPDNKITLFETNTLTKIKEITLGTDDDIFRVHFMGNKINPFYAWVIRSDNKPSVLLEIDSQTGQIVRSLPYENGGCAMLPAPDQQSFAVNSWADGEDPGFVEIIDALTAKSRFSMKGDQKTYRRLKEFPFFFLSPTQLVCGDLLRCDLKAKSVMQPPWIGDCIGGVGAHQCVVYNQDGLIARHDLNGNWRQDFSQGLGCAFFVTEERGLELHDVSRKKLLHRWPELPFADYIDVSPSLKYMAVHQEHSTANWPEYKGGVIDVYPFDAKWLQ